MKTKTLFSFVMLIALVVVSSNLFAQDADELLRQLQALQEPKEPSFFDDFPFVKWIIWGVVAIVGIVLFLSCFVIVDPKHAKSIELFGKFQRVVTSGLSVKLPWIAYVGQEVSLQMQEIRVEVSTITNDKVTVEIEVAVQFYIKDDKTQIQKAMYELSNPTQQIESYVYNEVRSVVPTMKLDDVFEEKSKIEDAVKNGLMDRIENYGYTTQNALVVNIVPDEDVQKSMNRINAAQRNAIAAEKEGDAAKTLIIKKAEAEAASKKLQGEGIADQRRAIALGIKDSVAVLKEVGVDPSEASALIVVTQHYDTLQAIGENSNSNLILLPNSPSAALDMIPQMVAALKANEVGKQKSKD